MLSETCQFIVPSTKSPILYMPVVLLQLMIASYYWTETWVSALVRKIQSIGILGMILAIAGGIVWFFQQRLLSLLLWGVAVIIILKINKQRKTKSKNKYRWFLRHLHSHLNFVTDIHYFFAIFKCPLLVFQIELQCIPYKSSLTLSRRDVSLKRMICEQVSSCCWTLN
jgi:hypothetical protein